MTSAREVLETCARAICVADTKAPDPDAPIYIGMRQAKAWEARVPMALAVIRALAEAGVPDELLVHEPRPIPIGRLDGHTAVTRFLTDYGERALADGAEREVGR